MSDRAKRAGVGGIFHTDELPAYGVTQQEVDALREMLAASENNAVVMVTGPKDRAEKALHAVLTRAKEALCCVPEETRRALPDGCSEYMRPLPGSARMYPETDVPPVVITEEMLDKLRLPELFVERAQRFERQYGLSSELARIMAASPNYQQFEDIMAEFQVPSSIVVRALETIPIELARENVPISNLADQHFRDCFALIAQGQLAKEGIVDLLRALAKHPNWSAAEAMKATGLAGIDEAGVEKAVKIILANKIDLVRSKGERAAGPLMGLVMKELRGKADGAIVSAILK
jgi:glutamyl-tRNA(Gln) amidotransferase subunit E